MHMDTSHMHYFCDMFLFFCDMLLTVTLWSLILWHLHTCVSSSCTLIGYWQAAQYADKLKLIADLIALSLL